MEWIFVAAVQAVDLLTIPLLFDLNTLARDVICSIAPLHTAAKTSEEALGTFLLLPLLFPAPVKLSITTGVAGADRWREIDIPTTRTTVHLPLFDAGAGAGTGCYMGSAGLIVSPVVLFKVVAGAVATFIELEGDTRRADGW